MRHTTDHIETPARTWQMSFNDLLTVLLTFFILLVAMSDIRADKIQDVSISASETFGSRTIEDRQTSLVHAMNGIDGIKAYASEGGISIALAESLLYHSGSADIIHKDILHQLSRNLIAAGGSIRIEGHTDNVPVANGSFSSNWELSTQRAVNVVKVLIHECGMDPGKLSAAGYADSRPIASNDFSEGRELNRRVNIIISLK